jgi:hypothetical protein
MKLGNYNYSTHEATDARGVVLGKFTTRSEAEEAMQRARLPRTFWHSETIPPIPLLQQLNDWVIAQNERRLPKWKFRFTADLAAQIQPKITRAHSVRFECLALQTENLSARLFTGSALLRDHLYWRIGFDLFGDDPNGAWTFRPRSAARGRLCPVDGLITLRQHIVEALHPDRFTHLSLI